eukprot:scaffold1.g5293.t1
MIGRCLTARPSALGAAQRAQQRRQAPQCRALLSLPARNRLSSTPQPPRDSSFLGAAQQHLAGGTAAAVVAALLLLGDGAPADAAGARLPPVREEAGRCTVEALDKFAGTRATFSLEASGGNMVEAVVDVRGCNYSGKDLGSKVLSGVMMQGADFSNTRLVGIQFARAQAQGARLSGTDLTDANCFGTAFDGADLEGAQFENAILSSATFGEYGGKWANLKGAHFEGALLSSSDIGRLCENPTLDDSARRGELGCRGSR